MIPSRYSSVDSLFWIWASKQWVNFRVSGRTQKATHILKVSLTIYIGYLLFCNYFIKFVDAFLLAIYNTEAAEQQSNRAMSTAIVNMPANPLIRPSLIKVPPLATSSTYHDSARLESEDKLDQRPSGKTNNPERVFGLQVRYRELDIFKILEIFWKIFRSFLEFWIK